MLSNLFAVAAIEPHVKMGLVTIDATLFFQILNTLILFGALTYLLFKPVKKMIEDRQNKIEDALDDAQTKNTQAEALIAEYDGKIAKIEEEGRQLIHAASVKAEKRANEIVKAAEKDAELIKKRAEKEIEREKLKAVNELKEEIVSLSLLAASKILEKDINQDQHKTLINQFLEEVGDASWQN
ncbi:MAG: F0F1 ATP synthase subunit B [Clostridia bacterium]|nr:F0F1 ATP synthase subunit B [Clostridia bacterium]